MSATLCQTNGASTSIEARRAVIPPRGTRSEIVVVDESYFLQAAVLQIGQRLSHYFVLGELVDRMCTSGCGDFTASWRCNPARSADPPESCSIAACRRNRWSDRSLRAAAAARNSAAAAADYRSSPHASAGNRDDENDQEHQHDVDQRRHVDVGVRLAFAAPPTLMAMRIISLRSGTEMIGRGDERHFAYADLLRGHEYLAHELVPNTGIAADMHFRLGFDARDLAQLRLQLILARQ